MFVLCYFFISSGKFTPSQRKLYLSVLAVQKVCISMCTRQYSLSELYQEMVNQLALQLVLLKLVPGNLVEDKPKLLQVLEVLITLCKSLIF